MKTMKAMSGKSGLTGSRFVLGLCAVAAILAGWTVGALGAGPNQLWGVAGYPQYSAYVWDANGNYLTNTGVGYPGGQPSQAANFWHTNSYLQGFENTLIERLPDYSYGREWDGNGVLDPVSALNVNGYDPTKSPRTSFADGRGLAVDYASNGYQVGAQPTMAWMTFNQEDTGGNATNAWIRGLNLATDTLTTPFDAKVSFSPTTTNYVPTEVVVDPVSHDLFVAYGNDITAAGGGIARWSTNGVLLGTYAVNFTAFQIALNPVNRHVLLAVAAYDEKVFEFDSSLNLLGSFDVLKADNSDTAARSMAFDMDGHLFVNGWDAVDGWRVYEYYTTNTTFSSSDRMRDFFGATPGTYPGALVVNWQIPEPATLPLLVFGFGVVLACRRRR